MKRLLGVTIATLLLSAAPASAGPMGLDDCLVTQGVYECSGTVKTWDGVPLDTTVILPSPQARKRPLIAEIHGFGNSKYEYLDPGSTAYTGNAFSWARRGYAVLTYTARGLWDSCGTPESRLLDPSGCARGYIHLADARYEVRDTQTLIGRLVDGGYAARRQIGVTGDSYGGGQSLMLAALRDRIMLPSGRLVRWRSPGGTPLRIAAAAPVIPGAICSRPRPPTAGSRPTGSRHCGERQGRSELSRRPLSAGSPWRRNSPWARANRSASRSSSGGRSATSPNRRRTRTLTSPR